MNEIISAEVAYIETQMQALRDAKRQLDAIPIAAIVRYWRNSNYDVRRANANGCTPEMFDDDDALIEEWVNAMENLQHG